MASGGEIDKIALRESFLRIKEDMLKLNSEIASLKSEQRKLVDENFDLKRQFVLNSSQANPSLKIDDISKIVQETIKSLQKDKKPAFEETMIKKINKNRRSILQGRIENLAQEKRRTIPDIKEIIVEDENLCSKATFYRYIEKMKKNGIIDVLNINGIEVLAKI
jgi:uncharacterized protein YutE (UPF0331/DUF86 family)